MKGAVLQTVVHRDVLRTVAQICTNVSLMQDSSSLHKHYTKYSLI